MGVAAALPAVELWDSGPILLVAFKPGRNAGRPRERRPTLADGGDVASRALPRGYPLGLGSRSLRTG